jgi:hypothetical protein
MTYTGIRVVRLSRVVTGIPGLPLGIARKDALGPPLGDALGTSLGDALGATLCKANQANEEAVTVYRRVLSYRGVLSSFRRSVVSIRRVVALCRSRVVAYVG